MFSRRRGPRRSRSLDHTGRHGKKYKWYTIGKPKPRASERDKRFGDDSNPGRERERITNGVGEREKEEPQVDPKELETKLHVTGIKLHIAENTKAHHTDDYECTQEPDEDDIAEVGVKWEPELIIRRGNDFKMTIEFDRPYDVKTNDVMFMFNLGDDCEPHKGLHACFKVDETGKNTSYKPKKWGATVVGQEGNCLTVNIFVPAWVPIGEWEFSIRTIVDVQNGRDIMWQYNHTCDFITILFNPWCKEDLVYMGDEDWRRECVESDSGTVYQGSYRKISVRSWCFGQFKYGILDTALSLVRRGFGKKMSSAMANPSDVCRKISQMVNAPDDGGVLVGNWSGDYSGGAKPSSWNGSVKLLRLYSKTGNPVRYGQCWVFSGVTTTVCRAVGIPCRSVTNHSSAHNTDQERLSIDVISKKTSNGTWTEVKKDSIWNFHVWNECWFRTPKLNTDNFCYDGWQIIDATPQEYSDGVYCCGPAPLIAVKEGHLNVGEDTAFVYAEVNADKVFWKENEKTGKLLERKRNRNIVGKCISTHKPTGKPYSSSTFGSFFSFFTGKDTLERDDLTCHYKHPEGSDKEKQINKMAEKKYRKMCGTYDDDESDHECEEEEPVDIEIEEMEEEVQVGSGFGFKIFVKNRGSEDRTMKLCVKVLYKTYFDTCTGIAAEKTFNDVLKKGDKEKYIIEVDDHCANQRPEDGFNFEVRAVAEFEENDHIVTEDMDFRLRRPDLVIKGPSSCGPKDTIKVDVSFKNPLKVALTKCEVDLEGGFHCVGRTKDKFHISNIGPGMTWKTTLELRPCKKCQPERELCVGLDAKELSEITGMYQLKVK